MTLLSHLVHSFLNPGTPQFDMSMARAVDDFREERSKDLAKLIESRSTVAAQLTEARQELVYWRNYARKLEKTCLAAGLELPQAPDE